MRSALKKIAAFCLAAVLALSMTGCGFTGLDAQALMSPPKTTADRQAIYALMRGSDDDVKLVYPKNGNQQSGYQERAVLQSRQHLDFGRPGRKTICRRLPEERPLHTRSRRR